MKKILIVLPQVEAMLVAIMLVVIWQLSREQKKNQ
jgi:hypothetical protein